MARLHGLGDAGSHPRTPLFKQPSDISPRKKTQRAKEQRAQGYGMSWTRRKPMK